MKHKYAALKIIAETEEEVQAAYNKENEFKRLDYTAIEVDA